jgi:hypothetical protein
MKKKIIVVFSSHLTPEENTAFENHVKDTIGVDCDVKCYENHNQWSLSQVYNNAIKEYHDDEGIMVFCHNDIEFRTKNWGKKLLGKFNNLDYQIIGVAGSTYMPESGRWWDRRGAMVGIVDHTNGLREWTSEYSSEPYIGVKDVCLIDGLFMAVDTSDLAHFFDEEFQGFHFYDVSMCFSNVLDGINIGVVTDIRILHKSIGMTNEQWEENRKLFVEKYKNDLPFDILDYS